MGGSNRTPVDSEVALYLSPVSGLLWARTVTLPHHVLDLALRPGFGDPFFRQLLLMLLVGAPAGGKVPRERQM